MSQEEIPLPVLRPDLEIHAGPHAPDGSPTFLLYDPLARTYDKINWGGMAILERLVRPTTLSRLMADLGRTTLKPQAEEVLAFCRDLAGKGLTRSTLVRPVEILEAEAKARKILPIKWLLHHYLYFRIPLLRPDAFLSRTVGLARLFCSKSVLAACGLFSAAGLVMLLPRMEEYIHTFTYFFNGWGLFCYGLSVAVIKTVHEFSHAYAAKRFGVRVPVMGVAFMVLWPVAYCDVTDAWKIPDRKKRLLIGGAGIAAEMIMAGLALAGWAVTGPGVARSVFFVLSSSSLLSTLLINFNPAMSFDGYYLLMDACGIDNLRPRAFALTRWVYRRQLLGLALPHPEAGVSGKRMAGMVAYSIYAWTYRFILYLSIAALVYYKFTKLLGIVLFLVEVWWFILMPFIQEGRSLFAMKKALSWNARSVSTVLVLLTAIGWLSLPFPRSLAAPAAVAPKASQSVYAPHSGVVEDILAARDKEVVEGEHLLTISSKELQAKIRTLELEKCILEKQHALLFRDEVGKATLPQKLEEIEGVEAQLVGLRNQAEQDRLHAAIAGKMYEWEDTLYVGRSVSKDELLGRIMDASSIKVIAYVSEKEIGDIHPGGRASFLPDGGDEAVAGEINKINPVRMETMEHVSLTSAGKGELPVVADRKGRLIMLESFYAVEIEIEPGHGRLFIGQSGVARLITGPRSRLITLLRHLFSVIMRESDL